MTDYNMPYVAAYRAGYEDAVTDAQEALTSILAGSSLSFRDLQGMRLALTVIQQISPDTEQIPDNTGAAK